MVTRTISGGDKLERALKDISEKVKRGGTLKVGFLSGSSYPDGTPVAMVAAIGNWGAPNRNIPPRPFFSNMIVKHSGEWPGMIKEQLKATHYDGRMTMNQMGAVIRGELQQSIRDGPFVALKPATIRAKGFATPLIASGHMLNSAAFEYKES